MKKGAFGVLRAALGVSVFLLFGCAGNSPNDSADDSKTGSYTDPASGVVLPGRVDAFERTALNKEAAENAPVSADYRAAAGEVVSAEISVIPASSMTPDQLLAQTIHSIERQPHFSQNDYRGKKNFGLETVYCTQCDYDSAGSGDRVTLKIVIVPHGNYLLCFTFHLPTAAEQASQGMIDGLVETIVSKSRKVDVMMPVMTGAEDEGPE